MITEILVLNGPRRCGKDTAGEYLKKNMFGTVNLVSFKKPLFEMVLSLFPISEEEFFRCYEDDILKESPHTQLYLTPKEYVKLCRVVGIDAGLSTTFNKLPPKINISPREAMIYVSECIAKPMFGEDVFGVRVLDQIKEGTINVITDSGFPEELEGILHVYDARDVRIVRIHRDGHDFGTDSRDYLPDGIVKGTIDVYNNSTLEDFLSEMLSLVVRKE